jgi:hypothetical protein
MNYELLQTALDTALATVSPALTKGVMCDADGDRDRFTNRAYTINCTGDNLLGRYTSSNEIIDDQWVIEVLFCGRPEEWFERLKEARVCAHALRTAIDAIPTATLNAIAESETTHDTVQIKCGNVTHDGRLARGGVLAMQLSITVTSFPT